MKVTPSSLSLSAGGQSTCLTRSDGTARCWGRNNFGQLGDGTVLGRDAPTKVLGAGWATISTSGSTTCGVKTNGTLWCWGLNNFGQVGTGRGAPVHSPRQVGAVNRWAEVATAYSHTCATRTDGTLWCWGQNLHGQLGIGSVDRLHGKPQRVGARTDWQSVTTGGWHSCALTSGGAAYCWGGNDFGELGDGSIATRSSPTPVEGDTTWLQLSAASAQTCGVTQTGRLLCWGFNRQGQLGHGDTANSAHPVAVVGDQVWTQVATGDGSTCGVDSVGQLWCWGDNRYGQLGQRAVRHPHRDPDRRDGARRPGLAGLGRLAAHLHDPGRPALRVLGQRRGRPARRRRRPTRRCPHDPAPGRVPDAAHAAVPRPCHARARWPRAGWHRGRWPVSVDAPRRGWRSRRSRS